MPWMMKKDGEKTCIYKQDANGEAEGDSLQCYDGADQETKAKEYMKALYANADHAEENFKGTDFSGDSLTQRVEAVRSMFYQKFETNEMREPAVHSNNIWVREIYPDYVIVENGSVIYRAPYSMNEGKIEFSDRSSWKQVKIEYVEMSSDFLFVELAATAENIKMIDGLSAGTFTAMNGVKVTFKPEELPEYVANTKEIIDSTRTESGDVVGLPIDMNAHDHQGGAGWIVDLELDEARNIIRFVVKWTQKGIDLIKGNFRRFFSPSAHPGDKTILGGSLTNWPATRDRKGKMILRPVELSQFIKEIDMTKTLEELQAEIDAKDAKITELESKKKSGPSDEEVAATVSNWANENDGVKDLSRQVEADAELILKAAQRKANIREFATRLIGGTHDNPIGVPIPANDVISLLLELPEKQANKVQALLEGMYDGIVSFAEKGKPGSKTYQGIRPSLPTEYQFSLREWVNAGNSVDAWFSEVGAEFGLKSPENYNLSEFVKKEA